MQRLTRMATLVITTLILSTVLLAGAASAHGNHDRDRLRDGSCGDDTLPVATGTLDAQETAGILFMVQEEQLARDVYQRFAADWALPLFDNIAASEQQHMDAVRLLIARYGLSDPTTTAAAGSYADPTLQALFDRLTAQGATSLEAALRAGGEIEELDIVDLRARIATTDSADVAFVYERLLASSVNHLRAFATTVERVTGEPYVPVVLTAEDFAATVAATTLPDRPCRYEP